MIKVLYVISNIDKSLAFEWIADRLVANQFEMHFILLGEEQGHLYAFLGQKGIPCEFVLYKGKSSFFKAFWSVYRYIKKVNPDIVHTHLFEATLIGLFAAKILRIRRRIYTRHHAIIHHQFFPRAVWYDRLVNSLATEVIALCTNLREVLMKMEKVPEEKIHLIPHGFDLLSFQNVSNERIGKLKLKYNLVERPGPVVGVISRYTRWKGVQYIIPAFKRLYEEYPGALLILANARGDYEQEIKKLLGKLPDKSYLEISFEEDIQALYKLFDVFVHVPVDAYCEAFGQIYVEALAAGIPSVFTLSGIACDFIYDERNAIVVQNNEPDEILSGIKRLLEDDELRLSVVSKGYESVARFSIESMIDDLKKLYKSPL